MIGTSDTTSSLVAQNASTRPAVPPRTDSNRPSVSSCRITRTREPPIARRTANSFRRIEPRASSMLARFMDAMTSTTPDMASSSVEATASSESSCGCVPRLSRERECSTRA